MIFSNGPPHMAEQKQGDQLEPTYNSSVKNMGCSPEVLPEAMKYGVEWRERVRDICPGGTTRWWWWWWWSYNLLKVINFKIHINRHVEMSKYINHDHDHDHHDVLMALVTLTLSHTIRSYWPSLPTDPLDIVQCPHSINLHRPFDQCKFMLVHQNWCIHIKEERPLRVWP